MVLTRMVTKYTDGIVRTLSLYGPRESRVMLRAQATPVRAGAEAASSSMAMPSLAHCLTTAISGPRLR